MILNYREELKTISLEDQQLKVFVVKNITEAIDELCERQDIHFRDLNKEDLCPYFANLWPTAEYLAREIINNKNFLKNKKLLELGCGLGLPSLAATKLGLEVLATDFHPDAGEFFLKNCRENRLEGLFQLLDWKKDSIEYLQDVDIILGSDVLYEGKHHQQLIDFFVNKTPKAKEMWITDPGRGREKLLEELWKQKGHALKRCQAQEGHLFKLIK